jgi:endoglucanase
MLALYEHYPEYIGQFVTNIPESESLVPDILEETRWNLEWMLTMQDTTDGGVYHKLTHANFMGVVMPQDVPYARFLVQKSTSATLNFCAIMAMTCRVFNSMIFDFSRFTDTCMKAALAAWEWAQNNPAAFYFQDHMNAKYYPDINTTAYEDRDLWDEFTWAATELFLTTGDERFLENIELAPDRTLRLPYWKNVEVLGLYSLVTYRKKYASVMDTLKLRRLLTILADQYVTVVDTSAYQVPIGGSILDFSKGSNGVAAHQGIAMIQAFRLTGDRKYLDAAIASLDYLLGRNATSYCFLTGSGVKSPMFPHHRQSEADGIEEPIPGLLVDGPNAHAIDGLRYPFKFPARCYQDKWESYCTNESTIDVNAALVYLSGAIEMYMAKNKYPRGVIIQKSAYPMPLIKIP